jgi:hypothetical protein
VELPRVDADAHGTIISGCGVLGAECGVPGCEVPGCRVVRPAYRATGVSLRTAA